MKNMECYHDFLRFVPPSEFAQEYLFFSDAMGYMEEPNLHIRRENFNNNLIMIVCSGTLRLNQNGKAFALRQGQGVFLNLEPFHEYYSDPEDPCTIIFTHINGKGCSALVEEIKALTSLPVVFNGERMKKILTGCFDTIIQKDDNVEIAVSKALYSAMMEIVEMNLEEMPAGGLQEQVFVNKVSDYINDHICDHIELAELAKSVNMSKYHFCRRYREETGFTPMQAVMRKKVDASKYFLQYTGNPIGLIAERFGFTDQSHYARLFRRYTGMSPLAYRKKGQN